MKKNTINNKINNEKKTRKKWTEKEKNYILEYSGRYSNKYLAKKFKVSIFSIQSLQYDLKINLKDCLIKHDKISIKDSIELLGISIKNIKTICKHLDIKIKNLGNISAITWEEFEQLEKFYNDYIPLSRALKMFKNNRNYKINYKKHLQKLDCKIFNQKSKENKLGTELTFIKKKEVLEYKNKINNSFTISEYAEKYNYHKDTIYTMIKNQTLPCFLDLDNKLRIPDKISMLLNLK